MRTALSSVYLPYIQDESYLRYVLYSTVRWSTSSIYVPPPSVVMSTVCHTAIPSSTFPSIFDAASKEYKNKTGQDLRTHPFAAQLDSCDSVDAILAVFQNQVGALNQAAGRSHSTLMTWLNPTVNILLSFSAVLGEGLALVSLTASVVAFLIIDVNHFDYQTFSPAKVMFTGIGILLQVNVP